MNDLAQGFRTAVELILARDPTVFSAVAVSLQVSVTSTLIAAAVALPVGYAVGTARFRGREAVVTLLHALMSVPTVAIGLMVYAFLSRRGLLGSWGWLYTRKAIVVGQVLLAFPLMSGLCMAATESLDSRVRETAVGLGARGWQILRTVVHEGRYAYIAAVVAGFGRVVSEVGISMMAGGNIRGATRTITTAIALETSRGEFASGIALGVILISLAFVITVLLTALRRGRGNHVGTA